MLSYHVAVRCSLKPVRNPPPLLSHPLFISPYWRKNCLHGICLSFLSSHRKFFGFLDFSHDEIGRLDHSTIWIFGFSTTRNDCLDFLTSNNNAPARRETPPAGRKNIKDSPLLPPPQHPSTPQHPLLFRIRGYNGRCWNPGGGYIFSAGPVFEIRSLVFSDRLAFSHLASDQDVVVDIILLGSMRNEMLQSPRHCCFMRVRDPVLLGFGLGWQIPRLSVKLMPFIERNRFIPHR